MIARRRWQEPSPEKSLSLISSARIQPTFYPGNPGGRPELSRSGWVPRLCRVALARTQDGLSVSPTLGTFLWNGRPSRSADADNRSLVKRTRPPPTEAPCRLGINCGLENLVWLLRTEMTRSGSTAGVSMRRQWRGPWPSQLLPCRLHPPSLR
jgi:hypothetical protein